MLWPQGLVGLPWASQTCKGSAGFTHAAPACCERCRPHKLFAAAQVLLLFAIILRFVEELRSAVHSKTLATPIISHSQVLSRQRITAARLLLGVLTSMHYVLPLCSVGKWRSGLIFASCLIISIRPETWVSQAVPWARAGPCVQAFCRLCCWCQVHTWDMFCFMPAQPCCSCHAALTIVVVNFLGDFEKGRGDSYMKLKMLLVWPAGCGADSAAHGVAQHAGPVSQLQVLGCRCAGVAPSAASACRLWCLGTSLSCLLVTSFLVTRE